ncbi:hypothetical protein AgCh_023604 [Apium graveolens]
MSKDNLGKYIPPWMRDRARGSSHRSGSRDSFAGGDSGSGSGRWLREDTSMSSAAPVVNVPRHSDSSSSSTSGGRRVTLTPLIQNCYTQSEANHRYDGDWVKNKEPVGCDIEARIRNGKKKGFFAAAEIVYSVFLLGSMNLSPRNFNADKLVAELYARGFSKVQHGVFVTIDRDQPKGDNSFIQQVKVAKELAILFNKSPDLRARIRSQWLEHRSNGLPHRGTEYLAGQLIDECKFLISEYIKHAPSLGLTVEEYLDFTSTLYNQCNPNFGDINQKKNYAFIKPEHSFAKLSLDNTFTKETLYTRLISVPPPNQHIPNQVISQCNKSHDICILTEVRYSFKWEKEKNNVYLVRSDPSIGYRLDFCRHEGNDHVFSYLSEQDRIDLQSAISQNPSYGFYENLTEAQKNQPRAVAEIYQPEVLDEVGGWTAGRKGKGKGKGKRKE